MDPRASTSSTGTSHRLRTKTSELSELLRWREHADASTTTVTEPQTGPTSSKTKRRLPFLGLSRKKHDSAESSSSSGSSIPQPSPHASPRQSTNSHVTSSSRAQSRAPSMLSQSVVLDLRSTSPATLKPTRSITPSSTRQTSPASAQRLSEETAPSSVGDPAQDGPVITVSTPSQEKAPGRSAGPRTQSPATPRPNRLSHATPRRTSAAPRASQALSDGEATRAPRERKTSFLDRLRHNRSDLSRTPSTQSARKLDAEVLSDPEPSANTRRSLRPPNPSVVTSGLPVSSGSASASPAGNSGSVPSTSITRRQSTLPGTVHRSDSTASVRPSIRASDNAGTQAGNASDSGTSTRLPSRQALTRPSARSNPSAYKPSQKQTSGTPPSPSVQTGSWLLTKATTPSSGLPASPSSRSPGAPHTRRRSSSESQVPDAISQAGATASRSVDATNVDKSARRQSLKGSTLLKTPPSGPLPDLPPVPASSSPAVPSRTPSFVSVSPSAISSVSLTSGVSSNPSTLATSVSSASSRPGLRSIPSNASLTSRVKRPTDDVDKKPAPKTRSATPSGKASSLKKPSPSPSAAAKSTQASFTSLAPTPANIYALQSENLALKEKIEALERAARRHEREIRGLRWLVVNGSSVTFANMGQLADEADRVGSSARPTPTSPTSTAFSDNEPLSDGTTDAASRSAYEQKIGRGFESDTGVRYQPMRAAAASPISYTSASEASGSEMSARKRSTALERARAAREQADKVLGRDAVDGELGAIEESSPVTPTEDAAQDSSSSGTPTGPTIPVSEPPSRLAPPTQAEEPRRSKDEKRSSRVFKRLSGISLSGASTKAEVSPAPHSEDDGPPPRGTSRLRQPQSIDQVLRSRRDPAVLDKLKNFAGVSHHNRS
ncbi:unnamed protein product [Peniophora sp. CBMAI 1063]|nr:unnamed protein product [Peniophora sp. CBMAI 1063]